MPAPTPSNYSIVISKQLSKANFQCLGSMFVIIIGINSARRITNIA